MEVGNQLADIGWAIGGAWSSQYLKIDWDDDNGVKNFEASCRTDIPQWINDYMWDWTNPENQRQNRHTIDYFFKVFGEKRVKRVSCRMGVDIAEKYEYGQGLSFKDTERLFVGLSDVRVKDINELFHQIKSQPRQVGNILHLSKRESADLVNEFRYIRTEEDLINSPKEKIQKLVELLAPFNCVEDIFLGDLPDTDAACWGWGKSYKRHKQLVCCLWQMKTDLRFERFPDWITRVGKRISGKQPEEGTLIPHPKGYYAVHEVLEEGGGMKLFLKSFGVKDEDFHNGVLYRGTRADLTQHGVSSVLDDFRNNMGAGCIMKTFEHTDAMLNDCSLGFVESRNDPIWFLGMSLGGGHAQRDFCLQVLRNIKTRSKRDLQLLTVNSVNVDRLTAVAFSQLPKLHEGDLSITRLIDTEDIVNFFGETHLGLGCDPKDVDIEAYALEFLDEDKHHLNNHVEENAWPEPKELPESFFAGLMRFAKAMMGPHIRETKSWPHMTYRMTNQCPMGRRFIDTIFAVDKDPRRSWWEQKRKAVSFGKSDAFVNFMNSLEFCDA